MKRKKHEKLGTMNDEIGTMPKFTTIQEAMKIIHSLADDERSHIMFKDIIDWMQLKLDEIEFIARHYISKPTKKRKVKG